MEPSADTPLARWSTPECPFTVEYMPRVLDDIRLAVVDAFFSLPRGGAEIGGILLGRPDKGRVVITDAVALDCEHAFGPSFTLSETDLAKLSAQLAEAAKAPNSKPVGWYHSHTRSEIFLSEADREIHKRFFREPWQIALVLKPHTFLPMRAGFFFREQDGTMRAEASYKEFQIDPLPFGKLPAEEAEPAAAAAAAAPASTGRVIDISRASAPDATPEPAKAAEPKAAASPEPELPLAAPGFATAEPEPSRRWIAPVAIVAGLVLGAAGFTARQLWTAKPATVLPAGMVSQASAGLAATDTDGTLEIRWDPKADDVQRSTGGLLLITDGAQARSYPLDTTQLRTGSYSYKHTSERVDVILSLAGPAGERLVQAAAYAKAQTEPGSSAARGLPAGADALRRERDELRAQLATLQAANARLAEANQRMEHYLEADRADHQRKRLENQSRDAGKL